MTIVAFAVSPHGFGHAARSCALMEALWRKRPDLHFEIITTVPRWFFAQSLEAPFRIHRLVTDVGLVQRTPLDEDLAATERRVDQLLDPSSGRLDRLSHRLLRFGCRLVVCDIAPLGLAAAARVGVPGVLVENFTWDWIYEGYGDSSPALLAHAEDLRGLFSSAELRIQAEPACRRVAGALRVPPMSRCPRTPASELRCELRLPENAPLVLLTMGGVGWDYPSVNRLETHPRALFVVPAGAETARRDGQLVLLPFRSRFFHPDLVHASDVVVGKLGYSTVAEAYHARAAMVFVARRRFRESAVLERFVRASTASVKISEASFVDGSWLDKLDRVLAVSKPSGDRPNGADIAAEAILERFSSALG